MESNGPHVCLLKSCCEIHVDVQEPISMVVQLLLADLSGSAEVAPWLPAPIASRMPEYAELHHSSHQINDAAYGHLFVRAEVNLDWTQASSLGLRVEATEDQQVPEPLVQQEGLLEVVEPH